VVSLRTRRKAGASPDFAHAFHRRKHLAVTTHREHHRMPSTLADPHHAERESAEPLGLLAAQLPEDLPTPALVVDGPTVEANLRRMADYVAAHGLKLRPHTKTHKSLHVARLQMAAGAIGLTTAKVGEAEALASAANDLLIAYPLVDPSRCHRAAQLARDHTLHVAIDSFAAAEQLSAAAIAASSTIGILIDADIGYHRTGLADPIAAARLAEQVVRLPGLRFDGLHCYPGNVRGPQAAIAAQMADGEQQIAAMIQALRRAGLEPSIVSGGSTPTAFHSHLHPQLTEIRPGTYVYYDRNGYQWQLCRLNQCAARVIATVVSTAVADKAVIDAGSKTLSSDYCVGDAQLGHGMVLEYPAATISRLTEEHGELDVSRIVGPRPRVGERVTVLPNHICPCINLQDSIWWRDADGRLSLLPVDARGRLS
jgi:D-serine deaminase-like pyridoxal phosphate-dependent protein